MHDWFGSSRDSVCQPRRGVIITPGALGDGLLMLPLARCIKDTIGLQQLDMIGHLHHISFYLGRTCIDMVRSIDSIEFHRLFVEESRLAVEECESILKAFSRYEWIISFLGHGNSDFENNLIFTMNCRQAVDIIFLPLIPPSDSREHVSSFYIRQFQLALAGIYDLAPGSYAVRSVRPTSADLDQGREIIRSAGLDPSAKLVLIHPGSGGLSKCWPMENFIQMARFFRQQNLQTVFLLGPAETERFSPDHTQRLGAIAPVIADLTITDTLRLLACCSLYAGNDSGVSHLASSLGIPTLVIFGPSDPVLYQPLGPQVRVLAENPVTFSCPDSESVNRAARAALDLLAD